MSSEKTTHNPPESSFVENILAMLLANIQEQNHHSAVPKDRHENDSWQSEIEILDRMAEDRRIVAESVQLAARRSAAALLRRRNTLVPLHRLPSEVLALILLKSLDFKKGFDQMTLQSLAQVAHRWWEIIKSDPRFWTCIAWSGTDMALSIRKAGTLPLQLLATIGSHTRIRDLQQDIKSLLRMAADRWFKISLVETARIPPEYPEAVERYAFSRLEVLNMVCTAAVHVEIGRVERLREAWLSFVPCLGHDPNPINPAPLLTKLRLSFSSSKSYPFVCLASFLRQCPNLQELDVHNLSEGSKGDNTKNQSSSLISLPALRSLQITYNSTEREDISPETRILSLIRCPNLTTFDLRDRREKCTEGIDAAYVLDALWASSQFEPDALPLSSVVRNMGDLAYFKVSLETNRVEIWTANRAGRIDFVLPANRLDMEEFSCEVLPYLTFFDIPIEITTPNRFKRGEGSWSDILDRFQNVTKLQFPGTTIPVKELIKALSQPSSSLPGGGPRAPRLEILTLEDAFCYVSWTEDANQMAPYISAMLKRRRELFKSAGMVWPSNFRVDLGKNKTFNEDEGGWIKLY